MGPAPIDWCNFLIGPESNSSLFSYTESYLVDVELDTMGLDVDEAAWVTWPNTSHGKQ